MSEWRIEYDNDTGPGDESFHEWWTVTDGSRHFRCDTESDANFLFDRLSEWKTIESAPKDSAVLVYGFGFTVAHFNTAFGRWIGYGADSADTHGLEKSPPTHWTPLPSPPVTD